jgi:putative multiple sugar transport system permease protein
MNSFFESLSKVLRQNIREYGMYIALALIMVFFNWIAPLFVSGATPGIFLSSRNIANLVNQTGYIAVLAVGMTLVIVIRHIDLSVGFLAGFLGAVAAIAMVQWNLPWWLAILLTLILGVGAGLITGFLVAQLKIPSFVASLAGWLIYRGCIQLVTAGTGTIIIPDASFNAIGNGFIPDILPIFPGVHGTTMLLGLAAIVLFIFGEFNGRRKKIAYNFEVLDRPIFILKLVVVGVIVLGITWVLAGYNGLPWTAVVVFVVVGIYDFIASRTVLGRHIYAVGGNPEAAELSGISVKRLIYVVFGSMGMLSALSGILFASRLQSATTQAGNLFELDAIAAAYVGGVSAAGGVGKVVGSIIGALVMTSLTSGMNLMNWDISVQYIARGAVLAIAVIFDVATRNRGK